MNQNDIHELVEKQRAYFYSNETLNIEKRIHALKKLRHVSRKMKQKSQRPWKQILAKVTSKATCVKQVWS